jgi:hypothetical protein
MTNIKEYFKAQLDTPATTLYYLVESNDGLSDEGNQQIHIQVKTCTLVELETDLETELEGYTYVSESKGVPKFTNLKTA